MGDLVSMLQCSLCHQLLVDPVYNDCCGHVHCRQCISRCIEQGVKNVKGRREKHLCPDCLGPVFLLQLRKNFVLDAITQTVRDNLLMNTRNTAIAGPDVQFPNSTSHTSSKRDSRSCTPSSSDENIVDAPQNDTNTPASSQRTCTPNCVTEPPCNSIPPTVSWEGLCYPLRRYDSKGIPTRWECINLNAAPWNTSTVLSRHAVAMKRRMKRRFPKLLRWIMAVPMTGPPSPRVNLFIGHPPPYTPVIVCTALDQSGDITALYKTCASIGGVVLPRLLPNVPIPPHCTHVLCGGMETSNPPMIQKPTLRMCEAILRGMWLMSIQWAQSSAKAGAWLPEDAFEISVGVHGGSRKARERLIRGEAPLLQGEKFALHGPLGEYESLIPQIHICIVAGGGILLQDASTVVEQYTGVVTVLVASESIHPHETSYTAYGALIWRTIPWWLARVCAYLPME